MKDKRADSLPADADELATIIENANSNLEDHLEDEEETVIIPSEDETSN